MSTQARYSTVAIVFHWVIAVAAGVQLVSGFQLDGVSRADAATAYGFHKSLGLTIMMLSVLRLVWRLTHRPPPLPADLKAWERWLAQSVHVVFYVLLIGLPLGGWAMSSAFSRAPPISFFGLFEWPKLPIPRSDALGEQLAAGHAAGGVLLAVLIGLHIAGAVKHTLMDDSNVIWRMAPGGR